MKLEKESMITFREFDYYKRLREDYEAHGSLYVAFDFDNTIFDYHGQGIDYSEVIDVLRRCKEVGFKLILFTVENSPQKLLNKVKYCEVRGIKPTFVNESDLYKDSAKPYYNILLDDRAGLVESINYLKQLLDEIQNK